MLQRIKYLLFGAPRNPFDASTRKNIALIAFLAWIGLGADGLSSSTYGPAEAYLALGIHHHLALYLALATTLTVFIISIAYNQVIELFPTGGGGYKVATQLLGSYAGLVSGAALLVDYTLTIAISIASGMDALFSLLPVAAQAVKLDVEVFLLSLLILLNLRGIKESIQILMPIFLGFIITHLALISYGIYAHSNEIVSTVKATFTETYYLSQSAGVFFVISLFLRAYSLGGGTYTGLEAVSNNVNHLAEPRVRTGKWTMFYMALSLSVTAGGIILLYLLWHVKPVFGQTLNAVTFDAMLKHMPFNHQLLMLVLGLEAGLLLVAANTGFLGGPAVLANMAISGWVPKHFRNLSNRLVTQNGVVLFGVAAILILLWTHGQVSMLVVLYSMNVFLTFSLSLLGLCKYWWQSRHEAINWKSRLLLSLVGLTVCASILLITLFEKFTEGGWLTVMITSAVIAVCLLIKRHYQSVKKQIRLLDQAFTFPITKTNKAPPPLKPEEPTAVFLVGGNIGETMHTLLWVQRMFPNHFKNFVFISAGVIDVGSYGSAQALSKIKGKITNKLQYFVSFSEQQGIAATSFSTYGTDPVEKLGELAEQVSSQFSNVIFFAASLVLKHETWLIRRLHHDTAVALQRWLHLKGLQMVILPVKL